MRLCRFRHRGSSPSREGHPAEGDGGRLGVVDGDAIRDVTPALDLLPASRYPFPRHDLLIAALPDLRDRIERIAVDAPPLPIEQATLLSPVANPGKLIAAPVNYQTHLDEVRGDAALHQHNPAHTVTIHSAGVFLKASSSLVGAGDGVTLCQPERRTDHEIELACVIGSRAKAVTRDEALSHVAGYAIGLDITIRGSEDRSLRKSADTYSVLGPWLVTPDEIRDPSALDLTLDVNGEPRQRSNTRHLILGVAELIELASRFYTLYPGDVIFTGTPDGVGPIQGGDIMRATISGIGTMEVQVHGD